MNVTDTLKKRNHRCEQVTAFKLDSAQVFELTAHNE